MRAWVVVMLMAVAVVEPARADEDRVAAKAAYEEGVRQYDLREWAPALDAFKRAYLAFPSPAFLFNIAQCHRALGHDREALEFYRSYLRLSPDASDREETQRTIAELERRVADEEAHPRGDDTKRPAPSASPSAGAAAGPPPAAAAGATVLSPTPAAVAAGPSPAPSPVATPTSPAAPAPAASIPVYRRWWLWTAVGGALVAIGAGVAIGVAASSSSPTAETTFGTYHPF